MVSKVSGIIYIHVFIFDIYSSGEYIVMVSDMSSPPFMEFSLQPGFIQVKVTAPKKKRVPSKKEKGPK